VLGNGVSGVGVSPIDPSSFPLTRAASETGLPFLSLSGNKEVKSYVRGIQLINISLVLRMRKAGSLFPSWPG
jgi:hypothetical protein